MHSCRNLTQVIPARALRTGRFHRKRCCTKRAAHRDVGKLRGLHVVRPTSSIRVGDTCTKHRLGARWLCALLLSSALWSGATFDFNAANAFDMFSSTKNLAIAVQTLPDEGLDKLLADAITYLTELGNTDKKDETTSVPLPAQDDGQGLLAKLKKEQEKLNARTAKEEQDKKEREALKRTLKEQEKAAVAAIKQAEERFNAARNEAVQSVRNEEAAKRQQEAAARKAVEQKLKETEEKLKNTRNEVQQRIREEESAKRQLEIEARKAAEAKVKEIEERSRLSQTELTKKIRDEESQKRQQDQDARKAAEARVKEAEAAKYEAESARRDAERQRDQAMKRRDTLVAAAGGAGLGVVLSFASEVFRILGGPTVIAGLLRTSGIVTGKTVRFVEWDLVASPRDPDGEMKRVVLGTGQLTRLGLRNSIAKAYSLDGHRRVRQIARSFNFNTRLFYEPLSDKEAVLALEDGSIVVWSQVPASVAKMPSRSDQSRNQSSLNSARTAAEPDKTLLQVVGIVCRLSRGEDVTPWHSPHDMGSTTILRGYRREGTQPSSTSTVKENGRSDNGNSASESKVAKKVAASTMANVKIGEDSRSMEKKKQQQHQHKQDECKGETGLKNNGSTSRSNVAQNDPSTNPNRITGVRKNNEDSSTSQESEPALQTSPQATMVKNGGRPEHKVQGGLGTVRKPLPVESKPRPLSALWLLQARMPAAEPDVCAALDFLGVVPADVESQIAAAAAASDTVILRLWSWCEHKDVFRFVAYAKAHLSRTGRI